MPCQSFPFKKFIAPVVYFTLHAVLLACALITTPALRTFSGSSLYIIPFWVDVAIGILLFIVLQVKDPGFVPYDAIFFTDQDQVPASEKAGKSRTIGSQMELQHIHSIIPSPMSQNMLKGSDITLVQPRSLQDVENLSNCISDKIPRRSTTENKERISSVMTPIQEHRIEVMMTNQKDGGIVACEPSVGDEDEDDDDDVIDFNQEDNNDRRVTNGLATPSPIPNKGQAQGQDQADTSIFGTLPNNIEEKDNGSLNSTKPHDHNQQSVTQFSHEIEHDIRQGDYLGHRFSPKVGVESETMVKTQTQQTQGRQEVLDTSCNIHFQTGDEDEKRVGNIEDMKQKALTSYTMNEKGGVSKRQSNFARQFVMIKLEEKKFPTPKKEFENTCMPSTERVITMRETIPKMESNLTTKKTPQTKAQTAEDTKNINIEIFDPSHKEITAGDTFFVERRYCTLCNIEQPIRSKHCRSCDKCVARYDHHCPWIGVCVGEKNHQYFYWFLIAHLIELGWADVELILFMVNDDRDDWIKHNIGRIILALFLTAFFVFVASLTVFQTHLLIHNLTTWEKLSWNKITYLKDWEKKWGSPFSQGIRNNIAYFFFKSKRELKRWKLPTQKKITNKPSPIQIN